MMIVIIRRGRPLALLSHTLRGVDLLAHAAIYERAHGAVEC